MSGVLIARSDTMMIGTHHVDQCKHGHNIRDQHVFEGASQ